jgi:threonine aldolase
MQTPIELRSDTFTTPTEVMRQAIAGAEVGDDVWGEDPTVLELERRVAELLGKERGLFVPSGSMANLASLLCHTHHGDEVLVGWRSHCITYEAGAGAAIAGVMFKVLGQGGQFTADDVRAALPPDNVHFAQARLVWLENTHNAGGGRIFPQDEVERIAAAAHEHGLSVHLDGARLLNAAVALGRSARELVAQVDSTSICLSKGLGAPVGSVMAGSADHIKRAHRYRKMLGGGMRQVGILAAAGLHALEHNVERLAEDHRNARLLAEGLAGLSGIRLDPEAVQTNIVIFSLEDHVQFGGAGGGSTKDDVGRFVDGCQKRGLLLASSGGRAIRAVTHMNVDRGQCEAAVGIIREVLKET